MTAAPNTRFKKDDLVYLRGSREKPFKVLSERKITKADWDRVVEKTNFKPKYNGWLFNFPHYVCVNILEDGRTGDFKVILPQLQLSPEPISKK